MKIELPATPVDGYEIHWFSVESDEIWKMRMRYHASRTWNEVYPRDSRAGAPFRDQWQVFRNDRFTARALGWLAPTSPALFTTKDFPTLEEAATALQSRLEEITASLRKDLAYYERKLLALKDPTP